MTKHLEQYVQDGRLSKKVKGDLSLYCYTQEEFFDKTSWDDVTLEHRGKLYYKDEPVNHPFKKIFNLGEHPSTAEDVILERLENEFYVVMDKCNGHLFIVSCFINEQDEWQIEYHTKGCLDPDSLDMLQKDKQQFQRQHETVLYDALYYEAKEIYGINKVTLMFESIAEYDKHTMYDVRDSKVYGENSFVMLGFYTHHDDSGWYQQRYGQMHSLSEYIGTKVCEVYSDKKFSTLHDLKSSLEEQDREGYVVWFPDSDFRFKLKTKQYWALRMKKEFTVERIMGIYAAGGFERLRHRLPEELYHQIAALVENCTKTVYYAHMLRRVNPQDYAMMTKKELFTSHLDDDLKPFVNRTLNKLDHMPFVHRSVTTRHMLLNCLMNDPYFKMVFADFEESLKEIVDNM